jgi:hypothetical protein
MTEYQRTTTRETTGDPYVARRSDADDRHRRGGRSRWGDVCSRGS